MGGLGEGHRREEVVSPGALLSDRLPGGGVTARGTKTGAVAHNTVGHPPPAGGMGVAGCRLHGREGGLVYVCVPVC